MKSHRWLNLFLWRRPAFRHTQKKSKANLKAVGGLRSNWSHVKTANSSLSSLSSLDSSRSSGTRSLNDANVTSFTSSNATVPGTPGEDDDGNLGNVLYDLSDEDDSQEKQHVLTTDTKPTRYWEDKKNVIYHKNVLFLLIMTHLGSIAGQGV